MPEEQDLRVTSDAFLARLDRLRELEILKRDLAPGTDEQLRATREIEELAEEVLAVAGRQTNLSEQAADAPGATRPINEMPPRHIDAILAEWREAERALAGEAHGSSGWHAALADVERLRDEYRRAYEDRSRRG